MTATPIERRAARFWSYVEFIPGHPCWIWTGTTMKGYGIFYFGNDRIRAHRFAWQEQHGEVPHPLVLDHLCRNPSCVNPRHLEAVTNRENTLRGKNHVAIRARSATCIHGHLLTPLRTRKEEKRHWRECRVCKRESDARCRLKARAALKGVTK